MEATYEFSAYNTESVYGYGTTAEASQYLAFLNKGRDINLFEMAVSDLSEDRAEALAVNLRDSLRDLDLSAIDG